MRYEASRALRKRHEALRCVTDRHDNKRHERHEGGIHDLAEPQNSIMANSIA